MAGMALISGRYVPVGHLVGELLLPDNATSVPARSWRRRAASSIAWQTGLAVSRLGSPP